jgi:hypothetical protein
LQIFQWSIRGRLVHLYTGGVHIIEFELVSNLCEHRAACAGVSNNNSLAWSWHVLCLGEGEQHAT